MRRLRRTTAALSAPGGAATVEGPAPADVRAPAGPGAGEAAVPAGGRNGRAVLAAVAILAVGAILLGTGVEILPPGGIAGKLNLERVLVIAGLVAVVAAGARLRDFRTGLELPIALLVIASVVTTVHGGWNAAPLRFLVTSVGFFYLAVALMRRDGEARGALVVVALVAIVASAVVGVAQVAQGTPTSFYRNGFAPVVSQAPRPDLLPRAIGSFANPNLLATHVLLLAPLGVVAALAAAGRQLRTVLIGLVALAYLGLVLTFSRAGLGAALLGAGVAAAARLGAEPIWRRRIAMAGAVGLGLVLVAVVVTGGALVGGFGRPAAWRLAIRVASAHPVFGVGLGRAGDVMNAVGGPSITFRHAHNWWLTWWVEAGSVALVALLWITGWLLVRAIRTASSGSHLAAAGLAAAVGFFAFSLVDDPANVERIATTFWFVAAVIAAEPLERAPGPRAGGAELDRSGRRGGRELDRTALRGDGEFGRIAPRGGGPLDRTVRRGGRP